MSISADEVVASLQEIAEFVAMPEFQRLLDDMRAAPSDQRPRFVRDIIMNDQERLKRNIHVPEGMTVQRSVFMDGRPTLFCVTRYLSDRKRKVTITFDDSIGGGV